ncbi:hypothetical protein GOC72_18615 [Sinorhizobium medicae]|nr:hypothetical protein [Sinorhizobium medicae]
MTNDQYNNINDMLGRIAASLEILVNPPLLPNSAHLQTPENVEETVLSPWQSPDVPTGFDTVIHFFATYRPTAFEMLDNPIADTKSDGFWCKHQAVRRGLTVLKVAAPEAFEEMGIAHVNAYPISLLAERMAA